MHTHSSLPLINIFSVPFEPPHPLSLRNPPLPHTFWTLAQKVVGPERCSLLKGAPSQNVSPPYHLRITSQKGACPGKLRASKRYAPKCLKHPAGLGQKWIHCKDIDSWKLYCNFSKYSV